MSKEQAFGKSKKIRIDPLDVTRSLGYQTHRLKARKPWSKEEDDLLRDCVNDHLLKIGFENGIESMKTIQQSNEVCKNMPWDEIATQFDRKVRKPKDIRKRWVSSLDPNLRKGKWTSGEDELLMKSFGKWGPHWLKVSSEIPGRTEDQCAKRYIEVLDPSTKDRLRDWRLEEDLALISKVKLYGTSWRKISLEMESRPSLTCRNRWRKIITMIMRGKASEEITKAVQETSLSDHIQSLDELRESLRIKLDEMKDEKPTKEEIKKVFDSHQDSKMEANASPNGSQDSSISQSDQESPAKEQWSPNKNDIDQDKVNNDRFAKDEADIPIMQRENQTHHLNAAQRLRSKETQHSQESQQRAPSTKMAHEVKQANLPRFPQPLNPTQPLPQAPQPPKKELSSQRRRPHSSRLDWSFTLNDEGGASVANGLISSSELVQELIDQAHHKSLTISIHQHIHNHFGADSRSANFQGLSVTDELFGDISPYAMAGERNQKPSNSRGFETDFLGRSPNFSGLALDTDGDPMGGNLGFPHSYPVISNYTQKPGNGSSIGSRSTPGGDIEEIPAHRQYHFNYLPPTVKPQLGSSDIAKTPDVSRSLNPSPTISQARIKRRKKTKSVSSGGTPNGGCGSTGATPMDSGFSPVHGNNKTGIVGPTAGLSNVGEEEDLDFWESLRSLAAVPESNARKSKQDGPLDEYDYLYNFYEEQIEVPHAGDQRQRMQQVARRQAPSVDRVYTDAASNNISQGHVHRGLPFNPS
ncbi:LANO_0H24850g1_1 [Lachancea nothofagi CBS 11611]|uniref:LANO_0H24850g1_1 n=1 Tax=Lachancea nothofagi CBS 11611 TaxID=1266666 RepID=A0A1G4KP01_9SACH|nr:LANO_0H24850g1_1 [Lachancea nothofagi CBS 11611]